MISWQGRQQRRKTLVFLLGIAVGGFVIWILSVPGSTLQSGVGTVGSFILRFAAAAAALAAGRRVAEPNLKRAWLFISLFGVSWLIAEGIVGFSALIDSPLLLSPTLIEFLRLVGYLAATVAFVSFPVVQPKSLGRVRDFLDLAVLSAGVITLSWTIYIRPLLLIGLEPTQVYWRALFPVIDLFLVTLLTRLVIGAATSAERRIYTILLIGMVTYASTNIGRDLLSALGQGSSGALLGAGSMLGSGLFLIAALGQEPDFQTSRTMGSSEWSAHRRQLFLPLVFTVFVVLFKLSDLWFARTLDLVGMAISGVMVVLLIARQGVVAGQMEMRLYASLINNSADLGFICDLKGKFHLVNPSMRRAVAPALGPSVDLGVDDVVDGWGDETELVAAAENGGWSGEVGFRRQDGSAFPVVLSMRPLEDVRRSEPLLVGSAHDLTEIHAREADLHAAMDQLRGARSELEHLNIRLERKVEERTLELNRSVANLERLNEELKDLDQLKSEFISLVSHELRAPLTNIRGGIEVMLKNRRLLKSLRESLRIVKSEVDRLNGFVEDILDLSALEAGHFPLEPVHLSIPKIVREVILRFTKDQLGGRVKASFPRGLPNAIADSRALSSVLFYLIDNAVKYAPDGDVRIGASADDAQVLVHVSDTGPGIPESDRERVFDMFHRLNVRDSQEVYGHGLGLYMARRLIRAMGGDVTVEEPEGGGARVSFCLPSVKSLSREKVKTDGKQASVG